MEKSLLCAVSCILYLQLCMICFLTFIVVDIFNGFQFFLGKRVPKQFEDERKKFPLVNFHIFLYLPCYKCVGVRKMCVGASTYALSSFQQIDFQGR